MKAILCLIFSILALLGFRQNEPEIAPAPTHQTSPVSKKTKTIPARRCDRVQSSPNWLKMALNAK